MKAHRTDTMSLFFGLLFTLVAGGFLLQRHFDVDLPEIGWFIAGIVILLGTVMAVGALIPDRKPAEVAEDTPAEQAADTDGPMLAE